MTILLYAAAFAISFFLCTVVVQLVERGQKIRWTKKMKGFIVLLFSFSVYRICFRSLSQTESVFCGVFMGYLASAGSMDIYANDVYCIFYVPLLLIGYARWGLLYGIGEIWQAFLFSVGIYLLQRFVFYKYYGEGDGVVLTISFLFFRNSLLTFDNVMLKHMLHMLLSIILFAWFQLCKGNIKKGMRLKHPAAFIPSIAFASILFL